VPKVPVAPSFELSTQPVTDMAYAPSGFVPAKAQALTIKSSVADAGIRRVSVPPIAVMISLVYVLAVIGTGLYFLFYFLLSA
jgi:hypothetical protein